MQDIIEKDIQECIKKAKVRYSDDKYIYISKNAGFYCADNSKIMLKPEQIIKIYENINYSGINKTRARWKEVK